MILSVYPHRGIFISNSSLLFTYGEPTYIVFSFIRSPGPCQRYYDLQRNTTLVMEIEDHTIVWDEIIFRIKKKFLSILK